MNVTATVVASLSFESRQSYRYIDTGDHYAILRDPHVQLLAQQLASAIAPKLTLPF